MKRFATFMLGMCLAIMMLPATAAPMNVQPTVHSFRPMAPPVRPITLDPLLQVLDRIGVEQFDVQSVIEPRALFPAPPALQNGVKYPYGTLNGETVWIDSNDGPQTIKFANLIATTSGTPTKQITGVTGMKIRVLGVVLSNLAAGSAQFQDEAGSPNLLSGVFSLAANTTTILPFCSCGYFDTLAGASLDIATTGSSNVQGGWIIYCLH